MVNKHKRDIRGSIISGAWELFCKNGYDNTTVVDILSQSKTCRGSFYRYFRSKEELLWTFPAILDRYYEKLTADMDSQMEAVDKLIYLNHGLFSMIEEEVPDRLVARVLSNQLLFHREFVDCSHFYYRIIRQVVSQGLASGELSSDLTETEVTKAFMIWERGLLYDWCLSRGQYSLVEYSDQITPMYLAGYSGHSIRCTHE